MRFNFSLNLKFKECNKPERSYHNQLLKILNNRVYFVIAYLKITIAYLKNVNAKSIGFDLLNYLLK